MNIYDLKPSNNSLNLKNEILRQLIFFSEYSKAQTLDQMLSY